MGRDREGGGGEEKSEKWIRVNSKGCSRIHVTRKVDEIS